MRCSHWQACWHKSARQLRPNKSFVDDISADKSALTVAPFSMSLFISADVAFLSADNFCRSNLSADAFCIGRQIGPTNWPDDFFCRPTQKRRPTVSRHEWTGRALRKKAATVSADLDKILSVDLSGRFVSQQIGQYEHRLTCHIHTRKRS